MSEHSPIPPSSAKMWSVCTAWPQMALKFPQQDTQDTLEGEAVHEVAHLDILKRYHGGVTGDMLLEGSTSTNGTIITAEMIQAADVYSDNVLKEYNKRLVNAGVVMRVEHRVTCPQIHPVHSWGTLDCFLFDPHNRLLIIWDFKYGHLFVDEYQNLQCINYLSGLDSEYDLDGIDIEIRIVQPRTYHKGGPVRIWKTNINELTPHINRLKEAVDISLNGKGKLVTGNHCRRCQARHGCEAYLRYGIDLYTCVMDPVPQELSPAALGLQLLIVEEAMEALKGLQTGYQAQVEALIKSGKSVPWWGMESSSGRENWSAPVDTVAMVGDMFGLNLRKTALITPGQARKLGIPDEIIKQYSERKSGLSLVRDDKCAAARVFSQ